MTAMRTRAAALAAHLNRHCHKGFLAASTATAQTGLVPADEALVDFYLLHQVLPFGIDHGPAQLVQHRPGRLVAAQAELALQLHR